MNNMKSTHAISVLASAVTVAQIDVNIPCRLTTYQLYNKIYKSPMQVVVQGPLLFRMCVCNA